MFHIILKREQFSIQQCYIRYDLTIRGLCRASKWGWKSEEKNCKIDLIVKNGVVAYSASFF